MLFGSDWIAPLAELIGYGEWQIKSLMKGGDTTRFISEETAEYIRKIDYAFRASGGFTGAALPRSGCHSRSERRRSPAVGARAVFRR